MAKHHYIADSAPSISFHVHLVRRSDVTGAGGRVPCVAAGKPAASGLASVTIPAIS